MITLMIILFVMILLNSLYLVGEDLEVASCTWRITEHHDNKDSSLCHDLLKLLIQMTILMIFCQEHTDNDA